MLSVFDGLLQRLLKTIGKYYTLSYAFNGFSYCDALFCVQCAKTFSELFLFLFIPSEGLKEETKQLLSSSSKKKGKGGAKNEPSKEEDAKVDSPPITIHLNFKRYVYDPHKKMVQC